MFLSITKRIKDFVSSYFKKQKSQTQSPNNTANDNNGGVKQHNFNQE